MDQSPKGPPKRGTQPLRNPSTQHFSDSFVSTGAQPSRGTRPLQAPSGDSLKNLVSQKLDETRRDIEYVRHLTTLFAGPIAVLRYALHLSALPEGPLTDASSPDPAAPQAVIPEPFRSLSDSQRELSERVAEVLASNPKLKQRAQVAVFQHEEAVRGHHDAAYLLDQIYACSFEEAWDRLPEVGIERLKGKAYPICGFYDNFKNDPVINRVFPAPNQPNKAATAPLEPKAAPLVQPVARPAAPQEPNGLLGKIKGLFGKN